MPSVDAIVLDFVVPTTCALVYVRRRPRAAASRLRIACAGHLVEDHAYHPMLVAIDLDLVAHAFLRGLGWREQGQGQRQGQGQEQEQEHGRGSAVGQGQGAGRAATAVAAEAEAWQRQTHC